MLGAWGNDKGKVIPRGESHLPPGAAWLSVPCPHAKRLACKRGLSREKCQEMQCASIMDGRARLRRAETRFPGQKSRLDTISPFPRRHRHITGKCRFMQSPDREPLAPERVFTLPPAGERTLPMNLPASSSPRPSPPQVWRRGRKGVGRFRGARGVLSSGDSLSWPSSRYELRGNRSLRTESTSSTLV
jgi:hypothetical protein